MVSEKFVAHAVKGVPPRRESRLFAVIVVEVVVLPVLVEVVVVILAECW